MAIKHRYGDVNRRQALIDRNAGLIACVARQMAGSGADAGALMGVGAMGLVKAANTFDPARHHSFTAYSLRCIVREMLLYLHSKGCVELDHGVYVALVRSMDAAGADHPATSPGGAVTRAPDRDADR